MENVVKPSLQASHADRPVWSWNVPVGHGRHWSAAPPDTSWGKYIYIYIYVYIHIHTYIYIYIAIYFLHNICFAIYCFRHVYIFVCTFLHFLYSFYAVLYIYHTFFYTCLYISTCTHRTNMVASVRVRITLIWWHQYVYSYPDCLMAIEQSGSVHVLMRPY